MCKWKDEAANKRKKIYYTKIIIAKVRKLLEAINLTYINAQGFKYVLAILFMI